MSDGSIRVTVRFFAGAQAAAGTGQEQLTLTAPATVGSLAEELSGRFGPDLTRVLAAASYLVDELAATPARPLRDGDRIDVLPPFAGG
jgi:molybdopterin converting factor small subunit